jgi:hypothetical protein
MHGPVWNCDMALLPNFVLGLKFTDGIEIKSQAQAAAA